MTSIIAAASRQLNRSSDVRAKQSPDACQSQLPRRPAMNDNIYPFTLDKGRLYVSFKLLFTQSDDDDECSH